MNKKGRVLMVIMGIILQVALGVWFGFSNTPISNTGCFAIWCACAFVIYHFSGRCEMV